MYNLPFLVDTATLGVIIFLIVIPILLLLFYMRFYNKTLKESQRDLLDADLLELFDTQPDGMLTANRVAELTGLKKSAVKIRLQSLAHQRLVHMNYSTKMKAFYRLRTPIDQREVPKLSEEPFLTVQDVLVLFKHFDLKPNLQDLVVATRLPIKVIMREMRYFQKEGIIQILYGSTDGMGTSTGTKSFVLEEPYRSNPDQFLAKEERLNLELKEVLVKESLLV
ncbi:MAG: helix-turn-helix domain-containing protein [Bacteroidota bacterium]